MAGETFILFWACTRAILEFASSRDVVESLYKLKVLGSAKQLREINGHSFSEEGFPSVIIAGIVLLSQTCLTIANCSTEGFQPSFVKILGFQSLIAGSLILTLQYLKFLPNGMILFGLFAFVGGIISLLEVKRFKAKMKAYRQKKLEISGKFGEKELDDESKIKLQNLKLPKFKPIILRLQLLVCGWFALLMCFAPMQVVGLLNTAFSDYEYDVIDKNIHCYTILAIVNVSQASALVYAVITKHLGYLWANTEATAAGVILIPFVYMWSDGSYLEMGLPVKYGISWLWYGVQMYLMWPNSLTVENFDN